MKIVNSTTVTNLMRINLRTLQNRNFLLFLVALIITVSSVLAVTLKQTYDHSTEQLNAQFNSSKSVLFYKLEADALNIRRGLNTASKDFNIKSLIRSGKSDPKSLKLAMTNYQKRLKSDFIAVFDKEQNTLVSNIEFPDNLQFKSTNKNLNFAFYNDSLYLIALQAVKFIENVPTPDAWLVTGVNVSRLFSSSLKEITNFEVSIRYGDRIMASSMEHLPLANLTEGFKNITSIKNEPTIVTQHSIKLGQEKNIAYQTFIAETLDSSINVFFSLAENKARLNYENLIIQLAIAIGIVMSFITFLTFSFSKSIARPLKMLATVANQIRKGKYPEIKHDRTLYEVEVLSFALADMQSAIQSREKENHQLAYYSPLTGLPNRTYFVAQIKKQIVNEPNSPFVVLWMDVDRFKDINDTLGHEFGDDVIKAIAQRLQNSANDKQFLAYLDGDEFAAFIKIEDESRAMEAANLVSVLFEEPFLVAGVTLDIAVSIGVSMYPDDTKLPEQLMQYADIALYESKDHHQSVTRFVQANNKYSVIRLSLMSELKNAIEQNQLQLNYQPKIDIKTGKVVSVESLVRWRHPEHGFIFPDDFIPLAEQTGSIRHLTHWAINEALGQHNRLKELGYDIKMAVNISALDLCDLALPTFVTEQLIKHDVPAKSLILEVTESAIMSDPEQAMKALNMLKEMGIKLSIDDFGTGYSSMEQLKRAPVDELKIDKSFVLDLATNKDDLIIVRSITNLAHSLGMTIVAEGVEDINSLKELNNLDVETAQGYYISKPVEAKLFEAWLIGNGGVFKAKE